MIEAAFEAVREQERRESGAWIAIGVLLGVPYAHRTMALLLWHVRGVDSVGRCGTCYSRLCQCDVPMTMWSEGGAGR